MRLSLDNEAFHTVEWLLEVNFANMHYVDLYMPSQEGEGFEVKQTGLMRPVSTRDVIYPNIVFDLVVPTQSPQTYYLRFQNGASMTLSLTLWTKDAFWIESQQELVLHWLFYGVLIGLLFYNLFLLFSLREANYLYFVIELAATIFFVLSYDGYLGIYVLPILYYFVLICMTLSWGLLFISIILFTDTFLEIKANLSKLHWANVVIVGVWGMLIVLSLFTSYHFIATLMVPLALVSLAVILVAGINSWQRKFRPSRLFLIAWSGLLVSLAVAILARMGIISATIISDNLFRLGMVWLGVCWSFALADRINLLKAETESANRELRTSEHRLSQILEDLPLGVILYGKDNKPKYANQRTIELFSNPGKGIQPDLSAGRTLAQAIPYFSLRVAGTPQEYPLENFPVFTALHGEPASADDIEMDRGDERVSLEIQASPVWDDAGNIDSAVVAIQDITQRKQAEAKLVEYHNHLEELVKKRTAELSAVNEQLHLQLDWLSAVNLVNQVTARSADFTQIYEKILEIINNLFNTQGCIIAELNSGGKQLKILAHSCQSDLQPNLVGMFTTFSESLVSDSNLEPHNLVYLNGDQVRTISEPIGQHMRDSKIQTIALVPLILREVVFGYLFLEMHDEGRLITSEESNLLRIFSTDIAQLIEDTQLYEQAKALIAAEERNRLARDLHDSVTQVLFSATLLADVLPQIWRRDPELGLQRLDKLQRLTRGALAEMRTMLLELRPTAVINTPMGDLLAQLTEAIASRTGLPFQLYIEQIPAFPQDVQTTFYRIAQEALNNVVKHAQARLVSVSLSSQLLSADSTAGVRHEVMLVVQDDGVGFPVSKEDTTHLGIGIMRERAASIQASFSIESQPGYGTQVTLIWGSETGSLS